MAHMAPDLTDDPTVWPNQFSCRNSDRWLWEHHDRILKMRPRVLVVNLARGVPMHAIRAQTERLIAALAESTRYHGFERPDAPPFLEYEVARYVDLRRQWRRSPRSKRTLRTGPDVKGSTRDQGCDYGSFYADDLAPSYGFEDPGSGGRYLDLHALIDQGAVHELWCYAGDAEDLGWNAHEVIELKQYYDERCRPIAGVHGPAGNGHHDSFPWSGRTFRMAFFNPHRGTGCQLENFGHGLEAYAHYDAIGYLTPYFREFAELDLDRRYGAPFANLYHLPYDARDAVSYPSPGTLKASYRDSDVVVKSYVAKGGNVHWPPGARHHYDLNSPFTVKSTIENWRRRNGRRGLDRAEDFHARKFARYAGLAPDCMGAWTVYWRQCMPGLDNKSQDDDGRPMKNWWVFLFY